MERLKSCDKNCCVGETPFGLGALSHSSEEVHSGRSSRGSWSEVSVGDKTFPCDIPQPQKHATSSHFYFLSEIGVNCLIPFLKQAAYDNASGKNSQASNCTLVIDQFVELSIPLVIPSQFTLAGVGINGAGRLRFRNLGEQPAIMLQGDEENQRNGYFTVRDLVIENAGGSHGGIYAEVPKGQIFFERVLIQGFRDYGVRSSRTFYTHVRDCIIEQNGTGMELLSQTNGWRISGCSFRGNTRWGVRSYGPTNEVYIRGCRFANNGLGGVLVEPVDGEDFSFFFALIGNSFSSNNGIAAKIVEADSPRFIGNILFGDEIFVDNVSSLPGFTRLQRQTQIGFNASSFDANREKLYTLKENPNDP